MFVDTNVLVFARFQEAPGHRLARQHIQDVGESGEALHISRQVLREYLATVTRPQPWSPPIAMEPALADIAALENAFEILEDGPRATETLAALCREVSIGGRQIHNANIAATMLAHGERRLLTFNGDDFRRYGNRIELIGLETAS